MCVRAWAHGVLALLLPVPWQVMTFTNGLPEPGMEPERLTSPALAGRFSTKSTFYSANDYC